MVADLKKEISMVIGIWLLWALVLTSLVFIFGDVGLAASFQSLIKISVVKKILAVFPIFWMVFTLLLVLPKLGSKILPPLVVRCSCQLKNSASEIPYFSHCFSFGTFRMMDSRTMRSFCSPDNSGMIRILTKMCRSRNCQSTECRTIYP